MKFRRGGGDFMLRKQQQQLSCCYWLCSQTHYVPVFLLVQNVFPITLRVSVPCASDVFPNILLYIVHSATDCVPKHMKCQCSFCYRACSQSHYVLVFLMLLMCSQTHYLTVFLPLLIVFPITLRASVPCAADCVPKHITGQCSLWCWCVPKHIKCQCSYCCWSCSQTHYLTVFLLI
jgi:hypothetical protein